MIFLHSTKYNSDLNTINNLKALTNNQKTNVNQLMAKIKDFLPTFYQHDDDLMISSVYNEYVNLLSDSLIANGKHMLAYLLKCVNNLQSMKNYSSDLSYDDYERALKDDNFISNIAKKVNNKSTLYTLWGRNFEDLNKVKLTRTVPSDFNDYILDAMYVKVGNNLANVVDDKICDGKLHVPHTTRYHRLMQFINKDCSLAECNPCKFYQGNKYNYSEKDLNGKDIQSDLYDIAKANNYSKVADRLISYGNFIAKEDLGQVGLDTIIARAQIYNSDLKHQEHTIDEIIGQHWNDLQISRCIFHYEPKKMNQPKKCYQDKNYTIHCPINDDILHLHGEVELY